MTVHLGLLKQANDEVTRSICVWINRLVICVVDFGGRHCCRSMKISPVFWNELNTQLLFSHYFSEPKSINEFRKDCPELDFRPLTVKQWEHHFSYFSN